MMAIFSNSPAPSSGFQLKRWNRRIGRRIIIPFFLASSIALFIFAVRLLSPSPYDNGTGPMWLPFAKNTNNTFYSFEATSAFYPVSQDDVGTKSIEELCAAFPNYLTQHIQPVLKMGHGEKPELRDAQLNSASACFSPDELLVFSDFDEILHVGTKGSTTRHAIDILANLPQAYHDDNPDFANYDDMRVLQRTGKLTPENDPTTGKNGWNLDKYKFLAEIETAWSMRPGREWYVFYESDTYIVWDNMFRFLSTLNPDAPLYMGSPSPGAWDKVNGKKIQTWFANGGPGFVLSRGAMEKLMARSSSSAGQYTDPTLSLKWMDSMRSDCCGDSVLGWALWKTGIPLSGFFPMFTPYPLHQVPYTDHAWCQPVLTMHKTLPEDMVDLFRWEQGARKLGRPLLYADLYEFRHPGSGSDPAIRENWDNTNYDRLAKGHDVHAEDLEACTEACEEDPNCFQYMWRGVHRKSCVLMPFINYGSAKGVETNDRNETLEEPVEGNFWKLVSEDHTFTSGWLPVRIGRWRDEHVCAEPDWPWPSIERYF